MVSNVLRLFLFISIQVQNDLTDFYEILYDQYVIRDAPAVTDNNMTEADIRS
jgi:hypothetical protein